MSIKLGFEVPNRAIPPSFAGFNNLDSMLRCSKFVILTIKFILNLRDLEDLKGYGKVTFYPSASSDTNPPLVHEPTEFYGETSGWN
jgi:hypothetical protein